MPEAWVMFTFPKRMWTPTQGNPMPTTLLRPDWKSATDLEKEHQHWGRGLKPKTMSYIKMGNQ